MCEASWRFATVVDRPEGRFLTCKETTSEKACRSRLVPTLGGEDSEHPGHGHVVRRLRKEAPEEGLGLVLPPGCLEG
jgi:hypothetical protein